MPDLGRSFRVLSDDVVGCMSSSGGTIGMHALYYERLAPLLFMVLAGAFEASFADACTLICVVL
jgi:hypothetical protein